MSVPAAYIGVILIWSTTPLAIKWSSEGTGFLFGVTARMVLGLVVCLAMLSLLRLPLRWDRAALRAYLEAALGIFGSMTLTYWGAQHIPSGLISVLFGATPLITGLLALLLFGERTLTPVKAVGLGLGLLGLIRIFGGGSALGPEAPLGIAALVAATVLHVLSALLVKRSGAHLNPLVLNTGALLIAVALFTLTWAVLDGALPWEAGSQALASIVYLGLLGTALGFNLYYYALKHTSPAAMSLITLVTPVSALLLGAQLNGEHPGSAVWIGALTISAGLLFYQFGDRTLRRLRGRIDVPPRNHMLKETGGGPGAQLSATAADSQHAGKRGAERRLGEE